jgi:hypothetical protein
MDTCFYPANHKSNLGPALASIIYNPATTWTPYYNFKAAYIDPTVLFKDDLLRALSSKRHFIGGLLEVPPNTVYNWHIDTDRHCGLNMLVYDDGQSRCLFAPEGEQIVMPTVELKYEPNTFYVFNTKVLHTVINFTAPRYMFSLEFIGRDYGLTYNELLSDIKELGYGN